MHFWSKFGKPHLFWYWLIAPTNSQAQNGVNFDFQVQFDLEDHRQSPHKTIGILIKVFYISDPNLVILAWTVDELLDKLMIDRHTDRYTHAGNDNTRRPKLASGKNEMKCWVSVPFLPSAVRLRLGTNNELLGEIMHGWKRPQYFYANHRVSLRGLLSWLHLVQVYLYPPCSYHNHVIVCLPLLLVNLKYFANIIGHIKMK